MLDTVIGLDAIPVFEELLLWKGKYGISPNVFQATLVLWCALWEGTNVKYILGRLHLIRSLPDT